MGTKTLVTFEEYTRLSGDEWGDYVYDEGELIPLPNPTLRHADAVYEMTQHFKGFLKRDPIGHACFEVDFLILPERVRRPDVAFIREGRLNNVDREKVPLPFAPDLTVEIISPSQRVGELDEKVRLYLKGGVEEIWLVLLDSRHILVWRADSLRDIGENDVLSSALLPGFALPLREYFDSVR